MLFRRRPTADHVLERVLGAGDLRGKSMLVTGADSGIGFETARALASRGAAVWIGCLAEASGDAAAERIRSVHSDANVRSLAFDLGDLASVRAAAARLPPSPLHALICNAGVYGGPYALAKSGLERTLAVCYLGHVALVMALEDRLVRGAPSRVVMVSSDNHRWPATLEDPLPVGPERYTELRAYGQAKLACVIFARSLDARWSSRGVHAYSLHPGDLVSTGIDKDSGFLRVVMRLASPFSPTPSQAAATSVWAVTGPELDAHGGAYLTDVRVARPSPAALDPANAERLWALTERWLAER